MNSGLPSRARAIRTIAFAVLLLAGCFSQSERPVGRRRLERPGDHRNLPDRSVQPCPDQHARLGGHRQPVDASPVRECGAQINGFQGCRRERQRGRHGQGAPPPHRHARSESEPDALCPEVGARVRWHWRRTNEDATSRRLRLPRRRAATRGVRTSTSTRHQLRRRRTPTSNTRSPTNRSRARTTSGSRLRTSWTSQVAGADSASLYDVPGGGGPGSEHVATATYTAPARRRNRCVERWAHTTPARRRSA